MPFNRTLVVVASTRYELGRGEEAWMYSGGLDPGPTHGSHSAAAAYPWDEDESVRRTNAHYSGRWRSWNQNLRRIVGEGFRSPHRCERSASAVEEEEQSWLDNLVYATYPKCPRVGTGRHNVVAANNLYDKYYLQYFTGIRNVLLLPSTAEHVRGVAWSYPRRRAAGEDRPVLLLPKHLGLLPTEVTSLLWRAQAAFSSSRQGSGGEEAVNAPRVPIEIAHISSVYPGRYEYVQLAEHPAVVLLPYQVSLMTFYELYRMGVPIFVPSLDLLVQWHMQHRMLAQRSFPLTWRRPQRRSLVTGFYEDGVPFQGGSGSGDSDPATAARDANLRQLFEHDPNDEFSEEAVRAWVSLSDFYVWPHVQTFSSFDDLLLQLQQPPQQLLQRLEAVSASMREYAATVARETRQAWGAVVLGARRDRAHRKYGSGGGEAYPATLDEALAEQYGRAVAPAGAGGDDCYAETDADIER